MEKVLLADNDPDQLQAWSGVLRGAGYEVTLASSLAETQDFLIKGGFDLAVLDLHMQEDEDELDDSGLRLAQIYRETVPIIMLTSKPTVAAAVAALQKDGRSSPAVAFVRKKEDGPKALLQAARKAILPKVFVSHGRDDNARTAVVKFLENRGAHAVVLKEQPLASRTVLDAFEEQANVQFAIILMTADDEGRLKGDDVLQPRARQNVVFELGFLLAKLGRNRVVALCQQEVPLEWPSNYQGVLYLELDPWGQWQDKVSSAMSAVGIQLS
jgi:predicted nucleotide-binding protein